MRAIICDRCGKVQDRHHSTTATVDRGMRASLAEVHLCRECTAIFIDWINKEVPDHDNLTAGNT